MEEPTTTPTTTTTEAATSAAKAAGKEKAASAWSKLTSLMKPAPAATTRVVTKVETVSTEELYKGRSLFEVLGETSKLWSIYISEKYTAARETADSVKHNLEEKKKALDESPAWNSALHMIKDFGVGVKEKSCYAYERVTHSKAFDTLIHSKAYDSIVHNKAVEDTKARSKALYNSLNKSWERINEKFWEFWEPVEEEASKKVSTGEEGGRVDMQAPRTSTMTPTTTTMTPTTTTMTPTTTTMTPITTTMTPPTTTMTPSSGTFQASSFSTPPRETEMKPVVASTTTTTTGTTVPLGIKRPAHESTLAREQNV